MYPKERWFVLFLFLAAGAYYRLYFDYGLALTDEGTLVSGAVRILDGQMPYRDFYLYYPPGRFYLVAALFRLFGRNLLVTRWMWLGFKAGAVVLSYALSRRLVAAKYALIPALLLLLVPGPWFKTFYVFFPLAIMWFFAQNVFGEKAVLLLAGGMVNGAAIVFRHDVGLSGLAAAAAGFALQGLAARGWRRAFWKIGLYLAGAAAVVVPVAAYLSAHSALRPLVDQIFSLTGILVLSKRGALLRSLLRVELFPARFFLLLPWVICGCALVALARRAGKRKFGNREAVLSGCLLFGAAVLVPAYLPVGWVRLMQAVPLAFVVGTWLAEQLYQWAMERSGAFPAWWRRGGVYLLTLVIPGYYLWSAAHVDTRTFLGLSNGGMITVLGRGYRPFQIGGGTFYLPPGQGRELTRLVKKVREATEAGEPILVLPTQSLLYFLCDRPNPTRFIGTWIVWYPASKEARRLWREYVSEIDDLKVRTVVVKADFYSGGRPSPISAYLRKWYRVAFQAGSFQLLERSEAPLRPVLREKPRKRAGTKVQH